MINSDDILILNSLRFDQKERQIIIDQKKQRMKAKLTEAIRKRIEEEQRRKFDEEIENEEDEDIKLLKMMSAQQAMNQSGPKVKWGE